MKRRRLELTLEVDPDSAEELRAVAEELADRMTPGDFQLMYRLAVHIQAVESRRRTGSALLLDARTE